VSACRGFAWRLRPNRCRWVGDGRRVAVVVVGLALLSQGPLSFLGRTVHHHEPRRRRPLRRSAGPQAPFSGGRHQLLGRNRKRRVSDQGPAPLTAQGRRRVRGHNATARRRIDREQDAGAVVISPSAPARQFGTPTRRHPAADSVGAQHLAIDQLTPRPTAPVPTAAATVSATADLARRPHRRRRMSAIATVQPVESSRLRLRFRRLRTQATGPQTDAILDGFKIVGRAPEFSANGVWVSFSARRVNHTMGSDCSSGGRLGTSSARHDEPRRSVRRLVRGRGS